MVSDPGDLAPELERARERIRRLEEQLEEERRVRRMVEGFDEVVYVLTPDGTIEYASPSAERLIGVAAESLVGRSFRQVVHPEDAVRSLERFRRVLDGSTEVSEYRIVRADGAVRWVQTTSSRVVDESGTVRVQGILTDITERKLEELSLQEREERLRLMLEQLPVVTWSVDRSLRFTASQGQGLTLLGLKPSQVVEEGLDLYRFLATTDDDFPSIAAHRRALEGIGSTYQQTFAGRVFETHVRPLRDGSGEIVGCVGLALDVTDRSELEERLRHVTKMQAIGQLAGGVAHDFNNLLQVIVGYTTVAAAATGPHGPGRAELERIAEAAGRASELVRQLLTFSRREPMVRETVELHDLVDGVTGMLRRLIGEQLAVELEIDQPGATVDVDRGQLEQVLINLCLNSRDAMPEGGTIRIRGGRRRLTMPDVEIRPGLESGEYAEITVVDHGTGMPPEVLRRAVEPFFTTKAAGHGSGLGLATAYAIVERHGGVLELESEPGVGTTARVLLPVAAAASGGSGPDTVVASRRPPPSRATTVLVAEDEPVVRSLVVDILRDFGYRVAEAADGAEAVEVAKSLGAELDLAVLDVVMPRLGGHGAAAALRGLVPGLPVLFVSGYDQDAALGLTTTTEPPVATLAKPFRPDELVDHIERLLDEHAVGRRGRPPAS